MSYSVGDCVTNLPQKFDNRQDLAVSTNGSISIIALTQSLQELTETYEFEELKYQTPIPPATTLQMTAGNPIVPIATLLATIPTNAAFPQFTSQNVVDITDIYTFWMWFAGGVNTAGRTLEYRRITAIDMYTYGVTSSSQTSYGVAPPVYYSRFGNVLQVGPSPDQNYNYFVRVKLRHPFPAGSGSVAGQVVFMPDSWQEIMEYSACLRIAMWEGASEYVQLFHGILFGDPKDPSQPGLVQKRVAQMQRDEMHNTRQLSLRAAQYTYARS